jgi:hypothetical protein
MKNFLSAVPFVLISLLAADAGAPAGGGAAPAANTPPEPTGGTLEEKISSAKGLIANFFKDAARLTSELAAATKNYAGLETQFNELKAIAETEKTTHAATKGLLETEKTAHTATSGKLVTAEKNVNRLESLCDLKGIDKTQAVAPATPAVSKTGEALLTEFDAIKDPVARTEFYRKNKADIDAAYQQKT